MTVYLHVHHKLQRVRHFHQNLVNNNEHPVKRKQVMISCIINYYIYMSALPKNRQLEFSIRNYIWDMSEIFSISSVVKISLTFTSEVITDIIPLFFLCFSSTFLIFETLISM